MSQVSTLTQRQQDSTTAFAKAFLFVFFTVILGCSGTGAAKADPPGADEPAIAPLTQRNDDPAFARLGKILFLQCRACHATDSAAGHLVGPNLDGLFGSTAGRKEGFGYSTSLAESGVIWSESTLDQFLKKPSDYFPGTKMAFAGIEKSEDRAALIAYLRQQTR